MKKGLICFLVFACLSESSFAREFSLSHFLGRSQKAPQQNILGDRIVFSKPIAVWLSLQNYKSGNFTWKNQCSADEFGTQAGNKMVFQVKVPGAVGVEYELYYRLDPNTFELGDKFRQHNSVGNKRGIFKIQWPLLRDQTPFIDVGYQLTAKRGREVLASRSGTFRVSRPVMLFASRDVDSIAKNCTEVLPAEPLTVIGRQMNNTAAPQHIQIEQSLSHAISVNRGWHAGVSVNPLVGINGIFVSLFSLNYDYFSQVSKQHTTGARFSHDIEMGPGDVFDFYVQATRRITTFDAVHVDPCGQTVNYPGAIYFQSWGLAFPVKRVNLASTIDEGDDVVGVPQISNSCKGAMSWENIQKPQSEIKFLDVAAGVGAQ